MAMNFWGSIKEEIRLKSLVRIISSRRTAYCIQLRNYSDSPENDVDIGTGWKTRFRTPARL